MLKPDLKSSSVVKRDPHAGEFRYDSQDYCPAIPTDDYADDDDDHHDCGKDKDCPIIIQVNKFK